MLSRATVFLTIPAMKRPSRKLPADLKEVLQLVQAGKLFALQEWIKAGKPVRPATSGTSDSVVLRTAVETGFHSMVEELLRAGGWSPKDLTDALALAREIRQFDIAALLAGKGAQPRQATFRTSCEKLDLFMMEHLLRAGADPNKENVFADVLNSIKARPLLRFFRQFRGEFPELEDQAALALTEAVKNRQVRWTALLRWAGADPFRPVPNDLSESFPVDPENHTTAVVEAAWCGNPDILKVLHLKPTPVQAVQMLGQVSYADNFKLFQTLLDSIPKDLINDSSRGSSSALERLVRRWPHSDIYSNKLDGKGDVECLQCVERLLDLGARWNPPEDELGQIRRAFLKHQPRYLAQLLRLLLYTPNAANLDGLLEASRSPKLADNIASVDAPLLVDLKELRKTHRVTTSIPAHNPKDCVAPAAALPPP
jgi:hypothetical protein